MTTMTREEFEKEKKRLVWLENNLVHLEYEARSVRSLYNRLREELDEVSVIE